ncbi:ABC transporter ATP-binding protein [Paenibacillus macerans]|nr:ABC transporter ATP-binding protein [Paenibacillus macerans]MBS5915148.1 ABC transporter ATP-binding protein [Paenibacillus macerans]MEC0137476.1 ABC transporter ATP-binding protein [Paenibacillus macerans]UMV45665.1 ABC transporter ATP-binding protein [Paenibacillus macerans]
MQMVHPQSASAIERYAILVSGAGKTLNGQKIINNVSLAVPRNSIYAIIGPNGAGKTTLLRLMNGLLTLDEGTIRYANDEHQIAVLLENDYLFEAKTGRENISDFGIYFSLDPAQISASLQRYSAILQLDSALGNKVAAYSKGMRRKLSLLITLLRNTPILMLDELTSGVDPESRRVMRSVLSQLKEEGRTVILTSHDLAEVQKISDWIVIMKAGSIVETMNNQVFEGDLEQRFFDVLEGIK